MPTPPFHNIYPALFWIVVTSLLCMTIGPVHGQEGKERKSKFSPEQLEFFERKIRPVLAEHCYECHSGQAEKLQASLKVDSRSGLLRGGDSGPSISIDEPDLSLLLESVKYEGYEMPPTGKLPDNTIADIESWVLDGAPWPHEDVAQEPVEETFDLQQRRREHWAWQPITNPSPPKVSNEQWPTDDVDKFILQRIEASGASPASEIDEAALVRRVHFDLTGLPPSPRNLLDYLQDASPNKFPRLVDSLLESPQFGERWARHWLDLVRYAESRGHEFDNDTRNAYQYRDYVIRAMNADVPYDQFVREHIAGDLLSEPRLNPQTGANESVLATGFWFLGEWVHSPVDIRKDESDRFDNMIDVMSKTFLGVTVSCARCHDHKFDAISTEDYYALSGFLQSSDYRQVRFQSTESNRSVARSIAALDQRFQAKLNHALGSQAAQVKYNVELPPEKIVVDYCSSGPIALQQNGYIFGNQSQIAGDFHPNTNGIDLIPVAGTKLAINALGGATNDAAWNDIEFTDEPGMNHRGRLRGIPRPGRTLRSPTFLLTSGTVDCLVKGKGTIVACVDSHRLIAGPLHGETIVDVKPETTWTRLNLNRYVGHRLHLEFTPANGEPLNVQLIAQGASDEERRTIDAGVKAQRDASEDQAVALSERIADDAALRGKVQKIAEKWGQQRSELEKQIVKKSMLAMAMMEGTPEDDHLLIRGSSLNPGRVVPRHFLTAIQGNKRRNYHGSGRLELAQQINAAGNPLTSRVIVNRIWHHLFGRGIVPTTDDFGVLGQEPTHPQLLDHLAVRFRDGDQSIKGFIKTLVLTKTYKMSGQRSLDLVESDPLNLLWQFRPPRRLQGEAIRDSLLAISGRLDSKLYGPPIPIHLTDFMTGRGRPGTQGPIDGEFRRSIYTAVRRNFLSPFMLAFDTPVPFSAMGRRTVSNVPAQALIMLNHPLVRQLSGDWANRSREAWQDLGGFPDDDNDEVANRITWLYLAAFSRTPSQRELSATREFVTPSDEDSWKQLAHALVNAKEFIYVR